MDRRPPRSESPHIPSYDTSGAWTVGRAADALAKACARSMRPVPPAGALVLGPQRVLLHLTTPDENPPPGWSSADDGRIWWTTPDEVTGALVDGGLPHPYPRLVSLGMTGAGRILLNLAGADGPISLEGDPDRVNGLARAWSARLTTSPWSAGLTVVRVGFERDPAKPFTGVEMAHLAEATRILRGPGGGVLILARAPSGPDFDYVTWLAGEKNRRWSVVAIEMPGARWRLSMDAAGTVDSALLDEPAWLRT